jgi:hypothetical protein
MKPKYPRQFNLALLEPTFMERVIELIKRMEAREFDATVWETLRTRERAQMLAESGTGIVDSMHCYGVAADIISKSKLWDAPKEFWDGMTEESEDLGLVRVYQHGHLDGPHVQAIDVHEEGFIRHASQQEIHEFVKKRLDDSSPSMRITQRDSVRAKAIDADNKIINPPVAKEVNVVKDKNDR